MLDGDSDGLALLYPQSRWSHTRGHELRCKRDRRVFPQVVYYDRAPYSGSACGSYTGGGSPPLLKDPVLVLAPAKNAYKRSLREGALRRDPKSVPALLAMVENGLAAPSARLPLACASLPRVPPTLTSVESSLTLPMRARTLVVIVAASLGPARLDRRAAWPLSAMKKAFEDSRVDSHLATVFLLRRETHVSGVHASAAASSRVKLLTLLRRPQGRSRPIRSLS